MPADTADVDAASGKRSNWLFDTRRLRVYADPVTGVPVIGIGVPESLGGQPPPLYRDAVFFCPWPGFAPMGGPDGEPCRRQRRKARRFLVTGTPTRSVRPPLIGVKGGRFANRTLGVLS